MGDKDVSKKIEQHYDDELLDHLSQAITAKVFLPIIESAKAREESICAHESEDGVGTEATGYATPENGPFNCGNCEHLDTDSLEECDHPDVVKDPGVPKAKNGKALVDVLACCNYFRPKTKAKE